LLTIAPKGHDLPSFFSERGVENLIADAIALHQIMSGKQWD
jgi:hypothetical protein